MTISLTHAEASLAQQTPKEYLAQLATAAHALRQAKVGGRTGTSTPGSDLDLFREIMEPKGVS